jgi:hypothetical protein
VVNYATGGLLQDSSSDSVPFVMTNGSRENPEYVWPASEVRALGGAPFLGVLNELNRSGAHCDAVS